MLKKYFLGVVFLFLVQPVLALTQTEVDGILADIDEQGRFTSDFKTDVFLQQKHREKGDILQKLSLFRRDEDDRIMMLFTKPKSDAGKGFLVIDENLFSYTPSTGDWLRVSEDRISNTDANLDDFEGFDFASKYQGKFISREKLGKFEVNKIELVAKPDADVDVYKMLVWAETGRNHPLKLLEYAVSGKLIRTSYRTKWRPYRDENKKIRYIPMETRIYDEIEKGNQTVMVLDQVSLEPLPSTIFSKAWLESKSR